MHFRLSIELMSGKLYVINDDNHVTNAKVGLVLKNTKLRVSLHIT